MSTESEHLDPSELGTKEHWEQTYQRETQNFLENPNDEGVIWFDESNAEGRMLVHLRTLPLSPAPSFLDLGTGNGHLLFSLLDNHDDDDDDPIFPAIATADSVLVGIDYSPASVTLARAIAQHRGFAERTRFEVADIVKDDLTAAAEWVPRGGFEVVLDKGTFDAISLSGDADAVAAYPVQVARLMRSGGWLVITSCNWTEEELERKMTVAPAPGTGLEVAGRVVFPSFMFGGKKGQAVCTVCFRKV